ncbi:MAG: transcription termination factor Rho, partial [Saccharothrix sp.]|nr:transcription termination factor Rho [Saccharothrix sp.]
MTATLFREPETEATTPVAGVLDVQQDHAYLRTTGYLPGPADVYVPQAVVRRHGLRRGDLVTGASGTATGKQKFPPLVRVDAVNGGDPAKAPRRPDFTSLVPVHPTERLRLEHDPRDLTTRVVDLVMPIGKGQRALVVAPPKAGKTTVLQAIARGISRNNPECHLIVVLVGERPEEVTDIQRSVAGEVVAST